jgi:hypothetical protein
VTWVRTPMQSRLLQQQQQQQWQCYLSYHHCFAQAERAIVVAAGIDVAVGAADNTAGVVQPLVGSVAVVDVAAVVVVDVVVVAAAAVVDVAVVA